MYAELLGPEIESLIQDRNFALLKQVFGEWPAADLAELISGLPAQDQVIVFRVLPRTMASETFGYLGRYAQKSLLRAMGKEEVARIVNEMSPDDRTGLL